MLHHILTRFRRTPLPALGVLVFAAVLVAVLCALHASNESELAHYQEVYQTLPVKLTVTNLKGTKSDELGIYPDFAQCFTGKLNNWVPDDLTMYIKDVEQKSTRGVKKVGDFETEFLLVGTTTVDLCRELWPENGGVVSWFEGYGPDVLHGDELVCLVPQDFDSNFDETPDEVLDIYMAEDVVYQFKVVGNVVGGKDNTFYLPFASLVSMVQDCGEYYSLDALGATLADNDYLEEFRENMGRWFVPPDPGGMKVQWSGGYEQYYPYALDINDAQLRAAAETLESSLTVNRVSTLLVFILSAGAGFFVGFLMIRSRKREITLMRTLGEANKRVYMSFALEQMVCVILGCLAGGAYFMWQPVLRIVLFAGIYFIGLSAALNVFLRKNLLSSMKEDE